MDGPFEKWKKKKKIFFFWEMGEMQFFSPPFFFFPRSFRQRGGEPRENKIENFSLSLLDAQLKIFFFDANNNKKKVGVCTKDFSHTRREKIPPKPEDFFSR